MDNLYEYPRDFIGRKRYVSVRGHSRSIPKYKTYKGLDGYNYVLPAYGGPLVGAPASAFFYMPDKEAYVSPISGTIVEGRGAHREHMKVHGVVEVGDAKCGSRQAPEQPMPPVRPDILRAIAELS